MAKKTKNEDDNLDLSDKATRALLHDNKAMQREATKAGVATGLLTGVVGALDAVFMVPEFVSKYKKVHPDGKFSERFLGTVKRNKLLTAIVAVPPVLVAGVGLWVYSKAKSDLKRKQQELFALEQKEALAASPHAPEHAAATNERSWVERSQEASASREHAR